MDIFIPDVYQSNIYKIDYKKLKKNGIKCLLFDLDNTLVSYKTKEPDIKVKELISLLEQDFKVIIMSNSNKERLRPFKEQLNIDVAFRSHKPFRAKYEKILDLYKYKENEIACIGDQLLTDICGANRMGFTSILIDRIDKWEIIPTRFNRIIEKFILIGFKKKKILVKGEYYD